MSSEENVVNSSEASESTDTSKPAEENSAEKPAEEHSADQSASEGQSAVEENAGTDTPATETPESVSKPEEPAAEETTAETPAPAEPAAVGDTVSVEDALAEITGESPATSDSSSETDAGERPKLSPTSSGSAKAVPTYVGNEADHQSTNAPVEIPRDVDMEADLEAQIEAAMSGDQAASTEAAAIAPPEEFPDEDSLEDGTKLKGIVQSTQGENIFLDLGYRSTGVLPSRQVESGKKLEVDQIIDVVVQKYDAGEGLIHVTMPRGARKVSGDWDSVSKGQVVDCMVTKTNKGGLEVTVGSLRGFLPASQIDLRYVEDMEPYVGQKLRVEITEANPRRRNLVVSRRAYLQIERQEAEEMLWTKLDVNQLYTGSVKTIKDYGAFVDIGGVDAFLHIGEMSWNRINHPSEVLTVGQDIQVKVIALDREKKKISLGMKQLTENPWEAAVSKYAQGTTVSGKVTKVTEFGAFVELEPGIEGLVHISELAYRRVHKVTEIVKFGETYDFQVLEINPKRKRISLSLKALQAAPVKEEKKEKVRDEDLAPSGGEEYVRKSSGPLKGGISEETPGGLFGDPTSFN